METTGAIDNYLHGIYYTPKAPGSFSNSLKLWNAIKKDPERPDGINLKIIKNWLKLQNTHNIHITPKNHFPTEHIICDYLDEQWQCDLIQFTSLYNQNRPFNYVLTIIDCFSRFCWTRLLKTKKATEVAEKFQDVIDTDKRVCDQLFSDQGTEFRGLAFQEMLKKNKISHFLAYGPHHASICERMNRTIKNKLYKYFSENATTRYVDVLADITQSINNSVNRTLKRTPASININNQSSVYEEVYLPMVNKAAQQALVPSFAIGDLVRISSLRTPFRKGYLEAWTQEIFIVWNVIPSHPMRFRLKDLKQEIIKGSFYQEELQKVNLSDPEAVKYTIDKVLSYKKINGVNYAKIRWYQIPPKFDSFVKKSDLKQYKRIKR